MASCLDGNGMHFVPDGPRALLIDAMGTLLRLEDPAPRLRRILRERFAVRVGEARAREALAAEIGFYRANLQSGADPPGLARLRQRCAEVLREVLLAGGTGAGSPAAGDEQLRGVPTAEMTRALLDSLRFTAFPEAAAVLGELRRRGIGIVVVSNWDCSLPEVLGRAGLADLLDGVLTSAVTGSRKPDPEIFRRALVLANVPALAAVHVGDSLIEDVDGARAVGIPAILIRREPAAAGVAVSAAAAASRGVCVIGSLREVTLAFDREHPPA